MQISVYCCGKTEEAPARGITIWIVSFEDPRTKERFKLHVSDEAAAHFKVHDLYTVSIQPRTLEIPAGLAY